GQPRPGVVPHREGERLGGRGVGVDARGAADGGAVAAGTRPVPRGSHRRGGNPCGPNGRDAGGNDGRRGHECGGCAVTRGLELYRSVPRYAAARVLSSRLPSLAGAAATAAAPLRLVDHGDPALPGPGWVTVRPQLSGICGSDLSTVTGQSSFYFSPLVTMPFTPGHEVLGVLQSDAAAADGTPLRSGSRVVIDPVLGCAARGLELCANCGAGQPSRCDRVTVGHVSPGLQTGHCKDVGGGWARAMVAHHSQLHPVPDDLSDERAVLVEPLATAVHTAGRARVTPGDRVLVIGSGAIGLFTLLALRAYTPAAHITVVAKYRRQVELAKAFGADEVLSPSDTLGGVRRATRALRADPEFSGPFLLGGVDIAMD